MNSERTTSTERTRVRGLPDPHGDQPVLRAGLPLDEAEAAMILVHGRGAGASSILGLGEALRRPHLAYLAPQAAGSTWYPLSFLAPAERNQPSLGSALGVLERLVLELEAAGVPSHKQMILGFSQGACLALEFAARHPRRYGGVIALTGGLVGATEDLVGYDGNLDGTPIFLGSGDPDPHVPWQRVQDSAQLLEAQGAEVVLRRYPGLPHTVNEDELASARQLVDRLDAASG